MMKDVPSRHKIEEMLPHGIRQPKNFSNLAGFCAGQQDAKDHTFGTGNVQWILVGLWAGL